MKSKITATLVKELRPAEKPFEIRDTDIKGFIVRVQPSGVVSYYFEYRNESGVKRRLSFGKHGTITPFQAREAASLAAGHVRLGQDPASNRQAARAAAEEALAASANERTLEQFLKREYADWCSTAKARGKEDLARLLRAFPTLLSLNVAEITQWHLEKWRSDRLKAGISKATVQRDLAELRAALNRAVEWGFATATPFTRFKMLKFDNARVRFLSETEERRLRASLRERDARISSERESANAWRAERGYDLMPNLKDQAYSDHLTPMVLLSLNTGLRKGELFRLTWAAVDFERKQLTLLAVTTKSKKKRHVDLNSEALAVLKAWQRLVGAEVGLVFPSPHGGVLDNVQKAWSSVLKVAGIEGFVWHDLRHTFASKLVMRGVDLNTVRELLGHKDLQMTLRYAHLAPEHTAAAVAKLVG